MSDIEELRKTIRLYKFTLMVLCGVVVFTTLLYTAVLTLSVPTLVSRAVTSISDSRRDALLAQVRESCESGVSDILRSYDVAPINE